MVYFYIAYNCLVTFIYSFFLNIKRGVSELVKCATHCGLVSYVRKVAAPGDLLYEMLFLEAEKGNQFTTFTNPAFSDVRSSNKFAN